MLLLSDHIHEDISDEDGSPFWYCEDCDGQGNRPEEVKHTESCLVGEVQRLRVVSKALFEAFANEYHYRHEEGLGNQEIDRMQTSACNLYREAFPQ